MRPCPDAGAKGAAGELCANLRCGPTVTRCLLGLRPSTGRCFGGRTLGGDTKSMTSCSSRALFALLPRALTPTTLRCALAPTTLPCALAPTTPAACALASPPAPSAPLGLPCCTLAPISFAAAVTTLPCAPAPTTPAACALVPTAPDRAPPTLLMLLVCTAACALAPPPATSAPLGLPCALAPTTLHCALAPAIPGDTPDRAPPTLLMLLVCTAACALALPPATSAPLGLPCALAPTTLHCATPTGAPAPPPAPFAPLLALVSPC